MKDNILISTWWFNKALLYSIIIPGVSIGFYKHGLNSSFLWLVGLFLCVHLILFSYKIELQTERLTYWRWPRFISKGIKIHKDDICGFKHLPLSYARKIELAIFDVHLKNNKTVRLSLAAFSPKDVKKVLEWFGYEKWSE
jgi:hypothetical protein